jgi:LAGLIDADG DNA endonuclease family
MFNKLGMVGKPPYKRVQIPTKNSLAWRIENKAYESYAFQTFSLPLFTEIFNTWYYPLNGKNIKRVPFNIEELMTDVVLAYWIAGDGHLHKQSKALYLYTNSYKKEEVELLIEVLKIKFDITSTLARQNATTRSHEHIIRVPKREVYKVVYLVKDIIPKDFLYKIDI